jgi:hypothetical protein
MATGEKAPDAFRTIGELSAELCNAPGIADIIVRTMSRWPAAFTAS